MNKEIENSEQFINQVVGKKTGFFVSENYLEEIEDNFATHLFAEKNTKKTVFEIPSNYFNTLEAKILEKTVVNKESIKVISFKQRILKVVPLLAAAAVILFIGINSFNFEKKLQPTFDSITDIEMENWLENNSNNINSEDIVMVFSEDDFLEIDFAFTSIEDVNIERYIYTSDDLTILNELY
ncbi:hypothetical protein N9Q68_01715 [Polaribacter sp.]|nr:hypothetical protein [Polaribacter sp.]